MTDFESYCPHCGTGDPGEDYCGGCGEPLGTVLVPLASTREEAEALYDRAVEFIEEELEDPDGDPDERYGFGVCARGTCIEPCGPNGGCIAGRGRRRSRGR